VEGIQLYREYCETHGYIFFIEYLPEKTIISNEAISSLGNVAILTGSSLLLSAENGYAVYDVSPIDEEYNYGRFKEWHLYEPPRVRHPA
jgi:hypothetical protein